MNAEYSYCDISRSLTGTAKKHCWDYSVCGGNANFFGWKL